MFRTWPCNVPCANPQELSIQDYNNTSTAN